MANPTFKDFITLMQNKKIQDALKKSRTRGTVDNPIIYPYYKKDGSAFDDVNLSQKQLRDAINFYQNLHDDGQMSEEELNDRIADEERFYRFNVTNAYMRNKDNLGQGYGENCIINATDNYGVPVKGNWTFMENYPKYGFKEVDYRDSQPGDIVQFFNKTGPYHAGILENNDINNPTYNGTHGGHIYNTDIKMLPMTTGNRRYYRFVGTPKDSAQWKKDYDQAIEANKMLDALKYKNGGPIKYFKEGGIRNWDNYLTGKLINYAENADSVGYDPKKKVWYAPPKDKGYDTNQFGMGVDRNQTEGFADSVQKDKKGNEYLTEDDERKLRHAKIEAANKSANARYEYAKKFLGRKKYNVSKKKDAATVSAIYNLGPTHVANTIFEDKEAMKALFDGTDNDYYQYISNEYKNKGRNDRIEKESKMLGFPIKKK